MFDIDVSPHTLTSARVFHNNERTPLESTYLKFTRISVIYCKTKTILCHCLQSSKTRYGVSFDFKVI